mgnify:CR=1 FL=1
MYGIDKQGHPLLWDNGSGSAKDVFNVFTKQNGNGNQNEIDTFILFINHNDLLIMRKIKLLLIID